MEYARLDAALLPFPEDLNGYLSPVAFASYISGAATLALRDPLGNPALVLTNSFTLEFESRPGVVAPEFYELDARRLEALKRVFEFIRDKALADEDEEFADQAFVAIANARYVTDAKNLMN